MLISRLAGLAWKNKITTVPTLVGIGPQATGSTSDPLTVYYPSGIQRGDLLVLTSVGTDEGAEGWTTINSAPLLWGCVRYLFYTSGTSVTVSKSSATARSAIVAAFRGVSTGAPINANTVNSITGKSITASGITTTVDKCMVCVSAIFSTTTAPASLSDWANAKLESITELFDFGAGKGARIAMAYGAKNVAGATGDTTATSTVSLSSSSAITFALAPA